MEQLKIALAVLKKYDFWVICGLTLLVAIVVSMMANSDLASRFDKRKKELDAEFTDMTKIIGDKDHPNDKYLQNVQELHDKLRKNVDSAWDKLYDQQRENNRLPDGLSQDFITSFWEFWGRPEKLDPNKEIDSSLRGEYYNLISTCIPKLFERVGRRKPVEEKPVSGGAPRHDDGPVADTKKMVGIVDWEESDVQKISGRFKWTGRPRTLELVLAQEDLWVFEALVRIIENTNKKDGNPPSNHREANIKRILSLEIGQEAVARWSQSTQKVARIAAGAAAATGPGPGAPKPPTPVPGAGHAGAKGPERSQLTGRYVDDKGQPTDDPSKHYDEFRMMPIDIRVVIEQDAIPKLLAECANSNMPIDVRMLRFTVQEPPPPLDVESGAATPAAGAAGGHGGGGLAPRVGGAAAAVGAAATGGELEEDGRDANFPPVAIEVQGIIYIYNPRITAAKPGEGGAPAGVAPEPGPAKPPTAPSPAAKVPGTPPAAPGPATPPAVPGTVAPPAGVPPKPAIAPEKPAAGPGAGNPIAPAPVGAKPPVPAKGGQP
jgi:hypothetical protein